MIENKQRYFWGVFLVLAGAYLVVSNLGFMPNVGVFSILFTVACIAIIIGSIPKMEFGGIFFPLAIIGIIYDKQLHIESLTPWTILVVALLATIGFSLLFSPVKKKRKNHHRDEKHHGFGEIEGEEISGEKVYLRSNFGGLIRYVTSDDLQYVRIVNSFSGAKVYLDGSQVPTGNVSIEIDSKFCGTELYIPKNWKVVNQVEASFGSVDIKGNPNDMTNVTATIMGSISFGGMEIHYV